MSATYEDVKSARLSAGLTQKAMAERFEIPIRTVSDWERGLRNPPEWTCKLLVDAINRIKSES